MTKPEHEAILREIEALEQRFRSERDRHQTVTAELRGELHGIVDRGDTLGVSLTSMSKAMSTSRGRLKRMIEKLR